MQIATFTTENGETVEIGPGDTLVMHFQDTDVVTETNCYRPSEWRSIKARRDFIIRWKRRLGWFFILRTWRKLRAWNKTHAHKMHTENQTNLPNQPQTIRQPQQNHSK